MYIVYKVTTINSVVCYKHGQKIMQFLEFDVTLTNQAYEFHLVDDTRSEKYHPDDATFTAWLQMLRIEVEINHTWTPEYHRDLESLESCWTVYRCHMWRGPCTADPVLSGYQKIIKTR